MEKSPLSSEQTELVRQILDDLDHNRAGTAIQHLREMKDRLYAAIPAKQRQSRGITWVVQQISEQLASQCNDDESVRRIARTLFDDLERDDLLIGAPIFLMAKYGCKYPQEVFDFFAQAAEAGSWVVREFASAGFHKLIGPNKETVYPWLKKMAQSDRPNQRRMVGEALRPVSENRWLQKEPQYSLGILRELFQEKHPYPRTSVGNNLSDLSRNNPELIFAIVQELVQSGDPNSYWIAYRACRNLVKKYPQEVLDALKVDEYHYKDRHFYRQQPQAE